MSIGTTIKKLRRDREMTQEVLAEYLGVSVSAVSQWEADKTSPDLSLIAPLCHLFSVSADILLEIDLAEKKEQIAAIIAEANALGSRGYNREAYNLLSDGHKRFPDDFEIMYYLMYNAFWLTDSDCTDEERTQYQNTAIQIAERTLESCTIDSNRHGAIQILCCLYPRIGKTDRAIELANSMPPISVSQEVLLSFIGTGETKYRAKKAEIDTYIQFLSVSMADYYLADDNGTPYYSEDDNAVLRDKQIAFLTLMFEDGISVSIIRILRGPMNIRRGIMRNAVIPNSHYNIFPKPPIMPLPLSTGQLAKSTNVLRCCSAIIRFLRAFLQVLTIMMQWKFLKKQKIRFMTASEKLLHFPI